MPTSAKAVYLDSSAIVKLVVQETESGALADFLADHPVRVSCALARVEVVRAARLHGPEAISRSRRILRRLRILRLDNTLLDDAAGLAPLTLRSLDAIHLAAARRLGGSLHELVTYDARMARAAQDLGLRVIAPGRAATEIGDGANSQ